MINFLNLLQCLAANQDILKMNTSRYLILSTYWWPTNPELKVEVIYKDLF